MEGGKEYMRHGMGARYWASDETRDLFSELHGDRLGRDFAEERLRSG